MSMDKELKALLEAIRKDIKKLSDNQVIIDKKIKQVDDRVKASTKDLGQVTNIAQTMMTAYNANSGSIEAVVNEIGKLVQERREQIKYLPDDSQAVSEDA